MEACWARVAAYEHAVLGTVHPVRGVDLVPVVYALTPDRRIIVPIDTVKPKASTRLQRRVNIERDPRCSVLVDAYDADWSKLWWVRVTGTAVVVDGTLPQLERFAAYRVPNAVVASIVITPTDVIGWMA